MRTAAYNIAPGPRGRWLLGNLLDVRNDRLGFITAITQHYGDVVRFRMGPRVLHLVSHPSHVRYVLLDNSANYRKGVGLAEAKKWLGEGLVTSEGKIWSRQRRLVQPAFQQERLSAFAPVVTSATSAMLDRWVAYAERGERIDIASEIMGLTLTVIARFLFRTDISNAGEVGTAFTAAMRDAMDQMMAIVALPDWLPFPGKRRFKRAIELLDAIVLRIIRDHRAANGPAGDFLTALMAQPEGFRDDELRDQVMTILLAGHETTAISLAWTLYMLDQNPKVWGQLRAEIEDVLRGREPTEDMLPRLVFTRMVYKESLRLYPPVWLIPRRSNCADIVGGYLVPANSDVLVSPWVLHRLEQWWPEPDVCDPDRFSIERSKDRPQYSYLPFGAGPRVCIGSSLAMMEALLILSMVVQRFRPRLAQGHSVVPEPLLTLRFRHGLFMTLEPA